MSDKERPTGPTGPGPDIGSGSVSGSGSGSGPWIPPHGARRPLPDHPVRIALLDLLAEVGTVTSTEAAARLGHSSGLCSFHLRQLARYGLIEEAPPTDGRARPWQLRWESDHLADQVGAVEFTALTHGLEDESYRHRLAHLEQAPAAWRHDESFSAVLRLSPDEVTQLAASMRQLMADFQARHDAAATRPADTVAVAAVARLFPLLDEDTAPTQRADRTPDGV
ncbi:winged helix-turn-helix domain-containing protein [Streptomyces sp. AcE210]|uniref:ArsR/SmtB family transcription factor n=1 Tax=Streptomyces sp. AcE210 TaxID=2292703 RepID=UPI000E3042B2|nr:winged helix-turn-helix domain-containing protein [Streptomyces sp. AcE210]RFC77049.1 ArsR family transcriptional regulator [Streptomyces sp. AcE210]